MMIQKKTGFNGYIYDLSTDYSAIDVYNIKDMCSDLSNKYLFQQ